MKKIELSQIAQTAKETASHIGGLIADGRVDPDNLLVIAGEHHNHIGHQYFEKKLIEYLHNTTGLARVFDERDVLDERYAHVVLNHLGQPITTEGEILNHNAAKKMPSAYATLFAQDKNIPVYDMDAPHISVKQFDDYIPHVTDVIGQEYKTRYADNAVASELMVQYASQIFDTVTPSHYGRRSAMLKRNLFMMDQVTTKTAQQHAQQHGQQQGQPKGQQKGLSLLLNGKAHVVNSDDPEIPSLGELLHANGKDIVMVSLHDDDAAQLDVFREAELLQQERVATQTRKHYFENINLVIADEDDGMTAQGLENVKRKNGDKTFGI